MIQQSIKQQARRSAVEIAKEQRRKRLERERRMEDLAVQVMTAVGERDAAVAEAERRAGAALHEMTDAEGLSLAQAVEWCGDQITVREATRLRRLVDTVAENGGAGAGAGTTAG